MGRLKASLIAARIRLSGVRKNRWKGHIKKGSIKECEPETETETEAETEAEAQTEAEMELEAVTEAGVGVGVGVGAGAEAEAEAEAGTEAGVGAQAEAEADIEVNTGFCDLSGSVSLPVREMESLLGRNVETLRALLQDMQHKVEKQILSQLYHRITEYSISQFGRFPKECATPTTSPLRSTTHPP
ncbi:hypothetical protein Pelo_17880 [Pelomyxa schiedti]|nr:hypothetical protein Pelo_17880 [Pelomyxa schiedti]